MELRADMVQQAQDDVKAHAKNQSEERNIQKIVDRQTKELQVSRRHFRSMDSFSKAPLTAALTLF